MQAGKISKINKRAGGNKAVQVGIFQKIINLCSTFIRYSRVVQCNVDIVKSLVSSYLFTIQTFFTIRFLLYPRYTVLLN